MTAETLIAGGTVVTGESMFEAAVAIDDGTTARTPPKSFVIWMQADDARGFGGKRKFVEQLETLVPTFYEHVGQHLKA